MNDCKVMRRMRIQHGTVNLITGESEITREEIVERECGSPLWSVEERRRRVCKSCAQLWEVEGSRITPAGLDFIIASEEK